MRGHTISDESIVVLIYQYLSDRPLSEGDMSSLRQWQAKSIYNSTLLRDILADDVLRSLLLSSKRNDPSEFWSVVVKYRAAMHNGMPPRSGNFWERIFQWTSFKLHSG